MGKLLVAISISLDGFVAGPNDGPDNPLGDGGGRLFEWWTAGTEPIGDDDRFQPPEKSRAVVLEMFGVGAVITGRRGAFTIRRSGHRRDRGDRRHREPSSRPGR